MLCLTRNKGEQIVIETSDGPIVITFVGMRGNQKISLGISAQRDIGIVRAELFDKEKVDAMLAEIDLAAGARTCVVANPIPT